MLEGGQLTWVVSTRINEYLAVVWELYMKGSGDIAVNFGGLVWNRR